MMSRGDCNWCVYLARAARHASGAMPTNKQIPGLAMIWLSDRRKAQEVRDKALIIPSGQHCCRTAEKDIQEGQGLSQVKIEAAGEGGEAGGGVTPSQRL